MADAGLATEQKKARRRGAEIVFVDETGFSFRAKTGTTWAARWQTPILRRVSKRRELSTVIVVTLSGKIYKRHFEHAIGATDILVALKHFQRYISRPMIIIWDRYTRVERSLSKTMLPRIPTLKWNGYHPMRQI